MRRETIIGRMRERIGRRRRQGGRPLQVGALPYRLRSDGSMEVLLVTTRGTGRWMVPKGWPMAGKTLAEAAAQEAYEEAGVRGSIAVEEIGRFDHNKTRLVGLPLRCTVAVFPMKVERELERWPERGQRRRRWFAVEEAARIVQSARLAQILSDHRAP